MFVIPILTLMIVYVRKYRNEITCCMIASLLAFCACMGAAERSDKDKEEQERKRQEAMAWEQQEQRRKNQEALFALESTW